MKVFILLLFIFFTETLCCQEKNISPIFIHLPDSFFTRISHSGFSKNDSFPIKERERLFGKYDSTYKYYLEKPLFDGVTVNDTNHLLIIGNGVYTLSFKYWQLSKTKLLIGMLYTITDFVEARQNMVFFQFEKGKYIPAKGLVPDCFPLRFYFEENALKKDSIGINETTCKLHYHFSSRSNHIEISPQGSQFDADYASDPRLVKLDRANMKQEKIFLKLQKGKFIVDKTPH